LTAVQEDRLVDLCTPEAHVRVQPPWGTYQRMIAAYREPDQTKGRDLMAKLIDSVSHGVPAVLSEPSHSGGH
jgi:hypothetical protein